MDKGINKIITRYIDYLKSNNYNLSRAYLFGSYARDMQGPDSDIDIALIFDEYTGVDRFDLQAKLLALASKIDSRIEPHPLAKADFNMSNPLAYEILKTGKEIVIN